MPKKDMIRYIDLFSGIGGIRIGVETACKNRGIKSNCAFTSEIKEPAVRILNQNFPNEKINGDITQIASDAIPQFDLLLAGFPCQPFSFAGKGEGFLDKRGTLFFQIERILRDKKPFGFILENVEGLVNHDRVSRNHEMGRTLNVIIKSLKDLGYYTSWKVLDARDFGVPQTRKRIFIVGTKVGNVSLENFEKKYKKIKDVIEKGYPTLDSKLAKLLLKHYEIEDLYGKSIKDKRGGADNIHAWDIEYKGKTTKKQRVLLDLLLKARRNKKWAGKKGITWMDGMPLTVEEVSTFFKDDNLQEMLDDLEGKGYVRFEHPKDIIEYTDEDGKTRKRRGYRTDLEKGYNIVTGKLSYEITKILDPEDIAPTLVATDMARLGVIDSGGIRRLTLGEGLKMFGFPKKFKFDVPEQEGYDLLGNTVAVPVITAIAERLIDVFMGKTCDKKTVKITQDLFEEVLS